MYGSEKLTVEVGIGYLDAVDIDAGTFHISTKLHAVFLHAVQLHGCVLLQLVRQVFQARFQLVLDFIGTIVGQLAVEL